MVMSQTRVKTIQPVMTTCVLPKNVAKKKNALVQMVRKRCLQTALKTILKCVSHVTHSFGKMALLVLPVPPATTTNIKKRRQTGWTTQNATI